MKGRRWMGGALFCLSAAGALVVGGCGERDRKASRTEDIDKPTQVAKASKGQKSGDGSGWWCKEHGVPEELCGQCDARLASAFKKKGDWCKEHDRPESQCFVCHPELKEKFAAHYRAKYGKEPPPIEDETKGEGAEKKEPKN